jgi:hypothetical protein
MAVFFARINEQVKQLLQTGVHASKTQLVFFCFYASKGAFWGLMIGLLVGLVRFIWQFSYEEQPCSLAHLDKRAPLISKVHYLHFAIILFFITCCVSWTISILTKPIPAKYVRISIIFIS